MGVAMGVAMVILCYRRLPRDNATSWTPLTAFPMFRMAAMASMVSMVLEAIMGPRASMGCMVNIVDHFGRYKLFNHAKIWPKKSFSAKCVHFSVKGAIFPINFIT